MIKKTVTFLDIDGRSCTEDFYFNLTKYEILELQVSRVGGYAESMEFLKKSEDQKEILAVIKEFLLTAYGERTDVSRHFVKKPEFAEAFSHTEAFSNIFMEMFQNADKAGEFFDALIPKDMVADFHAAQAEAQRGVPVSDAPEQHTTIVNTPRPRLVPQDHQKKSVAAFAVVDVPVDVPRLEPINDTPGSMPADDFVQLSQEDRIQFLQNGGKLV